MGSRTFRMTRSWNKRKPGGITDYISDIGYGSDLVVNIFVMEHSDHGIIHTYSSHGISERCLVEPAIRLSDCLLSNAHPMTRCRNARHISPKQCHILLIGCQDF